jgi:5-methylcytosine-specific restriction protein A
MTLHEAIVTVLKRHGGPMTTREIADEVNGTGLCNKRDGSDVTPYQVHGRTKTIPSCSSEIAPRSR